MQKLFEAAALIIGIVGIVLGLGGLGIWLGKDTFVVEYAGTISLIGLFLVMCAGGILEIASPSRSTNADSAV